VVDASALDPVAGAATFSASARQDFASAYGWLILYSGWFSGETQVSETFPTRIEFDRRDVNDRNGSLLGDLWRPLTTARATNDKVVARLAGASDAASNINIARSALFAGYSVLFMAEHFCEGTIASPDDVPGGRLSTAMLLDSAVARFDRAITVGAAASGAEAQSIASAARVGRARAHLQAGRNQQAIADANAVPAGFVLNLNYFDDIGERTRLGNRLWQFSESRTSITVAPAYRDADPRIPFLAPDQHALIAFDGITPVFLQQKYPGFASPIRLASKLEADFIRAEAEGTASQLALITARRAAAGRPAYTGGQDAASVRVEFFEQRAREFWLEGKKLGDLRRAPDAVRNVPVPGAAYFKPGFAPIGNQVCYPIPAAEVENNPAFRNP
jgi:hypothetical protein